MAEESLDPAVVHHNQRIARTQLALDSIILILIESNLVGKGRLQIVLDENLNPSLVIPLRVEDGLVWEEVLYNVKT